MSTLDTSARPSFAGGTRLSNISTSQSNTQSTSSTFNGKSKPNIITPKIQENHLGEAIQYRTQILSDFRDLGQPDLVHLSKYDKSIKSEVGEYHYVTGINTLNVIQPFMYLQTIQLNDKEVATNKHMKVGTYCCYNIFSKGDLRIRCQFPGSTSPMIQFVPSNKNKITINLSSSDSSAVNSSNNSTHDLNESNGNLSSNNRSQNIWIETYVSSLIRSILFPDLIDRQLPGMCKFNPIQSTKDAKEAIKLMCSMLFRGVETGCTDIYNRPSLINNHLVDALLKLLSITKYYNIAIKEIENLMTKKLINLNVLIVKILILKNDYAKAVRLMHDCLIKIPRDGWMLTEQTIFLINQNRLDLALIPAQIAIECLPSEFLCWKNLILIYILKKDFKNALLALNSSPMYTNKRKDIFSAIKPKSYEFSFPLEGKIESIWKDCEYFGCISGIGDIVEFTPNLEINKINSYRLKVYEETKLNCTFKEAYDLLALMTQKCGWGELLKIRSEIFVMEDEYNEMVKNEQNLENQKSDVNGGDNEDDKNDEETNNGLDIKHIKNSSTISLTDISNKFKSKRLSEKWLDSLFLIYYENLKNVLIYENDIKNKPNIQYSTTEWELIANECFKVHYFKEGLIPFQTCLNKRFSIFACYKLLNYYLDYSKHEKLFKELNGKESNDKNANDEYINEIKINTDEILKLCCKLISWSARYYGEFPILCLQVFDELKNTTDLDSVVLKNKIEVILLDLETEEKKIRKEATSSEKTLYKDMDIGQNVMGLVDRYISWLDQFTDDEM